MPPATAPVEAAPAVATAPKPAPETVVSMDTAAVTERQGLAAQMGTASSPDNALAAATTHPADESPQGQTNGPEAQQTPGQRAFDEIKNLGITIGPNTTVEELMDKLSAEERGEDRWQNDEQMRNYIQDAITYSGNRPAEAGQPASSVNAEQNGQVIQEGAAAVNVPAVETEGQAGQTINDKNAEATAQRVVDIVKGQEKKEPTLSPDERKLMEGFTNMISEDMDGFKKFYAALAKDDPEYAMQLAKNLEVYREMVNRENDAKKRKLLMALGAIAFIVWLTFNVATNDGGGQH